MAPRELSVHHPTPSEVRDGSRAMVLVSGSAEPRSRPACRGDRPVLGEEAGPGGFPPNSGNRAGAAGVKAFHGPLLRLPKDRSRSLARHDPGNPSRIQSP